MGNNDFTAGDPWGLPIEESEEYATDEASIADLTPPEDADDGDEPGTDHGWPTVADENGEETPEGLDRDEEPSQPAPEEPPEIDEPVTASEDSGSWSSPDDTPPPVIDQEPADEAAEEEVVGDGGESTGKDGEEYAFKTPARTPLSQMIAAAQSVVSSVQGTQETDGAEETDDLPEPEPSETAFAADMVGTDDTPEDRQEELPAEPAAVSYDRTAGEDDLPEEPPAWLITDSGAEERPPDPLEETAEAWDGGIDSILAPADIEASIAELATPAETPFAEDRFDMPDTEDAESDRAFRDVDMDSSPGVYSELHHLADEDEQTEALLREAAVAFGQAAEVTESLENNVGEIAETLPDADEIDGYAEALATELQTEDTPLETTDTLLPELEEETPLDPDEIDGYAEALATDLPDAQDLIDSDIPAYLSDVELGEALAGLTDSATGQIDGIGDSTEEEAARGWGELDSPDAAAEENRLEDLTGDQSEVVIEPVGWVDEEPGFAGDASAEEENGSEADSETLDGEADAVVAEDGTVVVDSPVAWGTRYRDAHQGWIEDDEGRSTWRPIVTSGQSVAGWDIDIYLGMVSGDVALDPPGLGNIAAEVAAAREAAGRRMLDEALARGAHAVVGVTFSIQEVGGAVLVAASGVAVTLRTPA